MQPSRVQKGDAAVLLLASKLTEAGLVVLQPLCEALPFDLALFYEGVFYRIQVKRAQHTPYPSRYKIPLRKTINAKKVYRYTKVHTDFIAGVVMEEACTYIFPLEDIQHISTEIVVDPKRCSSPDLGSRKVDPEQYRDRIKLGTNVILFNPMKSIAPEQPRLKWPTLPELETMRKTMTLQEIAELVGCTHSAVHHRLHRKLRSATEESPNGMAPPR